MIKSINLPTDNTSKLIERYGHHQIIVATNFFYLDFRAGMNFHRMSNGKIAYYTVKVMYS